MTMNPYVFPALDEITKMQAVSTYKPIVSINYDASDISKYLIEKYSFVYIKSRKADLINKKISIAYTINKYRKHFSDISKGSTKTGIITAGKILGIDHSTFLHRVNSFKIKREMFEKYKIDDNEEVVLFQQRFELDFLNTFKAKNSVHEYKPVQSS